MRRGVGGRRLYSLRLRAKLWGILVGAVMLFGVLVVPHVIQPSSQFASATGLVGPIVTSGSNLVDSSTGQVVDFKGFNSPANGFDVPSISTIKSWGANFTRVWVSDDLYEQTCKNEVYQPNYVSDIDSEVDALTSDGIFVVLVDGSTNPNCLFTQPQDSDVAPLPDPNSLAMFASLAQTFGSNPLVGFEPYNEPEVCPDSAQEQGPLVPAGQLDQDLELVYPQNTLTDPGSRTSVPTFGTCDGWEDGYPNSSQSNWSQEQADDLSAYALFTGGTVETAAGLTRISYTGEGFESIVDTLRSNGAKNNLIFVDANLWSSDPSTFDYLTSGSTCEADASGVPLSPCWNNLKNFVAAEHYYGCQWGGTSITVTKDTCESPDPESCQQISSDLSNLLTDPVTGEQWTLPVVLDEFGWPQPSSLPDATLYDTQSGKPIVMYQHGLFMQNMVSYLDAHHVGWAAFDWDNADQDQGTQAPYVLEGSLPAPTSTNVPWSPNADGVPLKASMQGQSLNCQDPPAGLG